MAIKGLFISPHQGFIAEMQQFLPHISGTEWTYRTSCIEDYWVMHELMNVALNLVGQLENYLANSTHFYKSKIYSYEPELCDTLYEYVYPFWEKQREVYKPFYNDMLYDIKKYDIIILGLSVFMQYFIRCLRPDIPIIYYPRMLEQNAFVLPIIKEADFTYVMHDKCLNDYKIFPNVDTRLIVSSLDPDCYGPWSGNINFVLTMYNLLYGEGSLYRSNKVSCALFDIYEEIVNGIPHQLLGKNFTAAHNSDIIFGGNVPDIIRKFRCALAFSRSFTAIATAQLFASEVPLIAYMDGERNEVKDIIQEGISGFISTDIPYIRETILSLLKDKDYAQRIGKAGKESYYATHPFGKYVSEWTELIHEKVR